MNFFSPVLRPIVNSNMPKVNSVTLKLRINLESPLSIFCEMVSETIKHIVTMNKHLDTVLTMKSRTGKCVNGRSIEILKISATSEKKMIDN